MLASLPDIDGQSQNSLADGNVIGKGSSAEVGTGSTYGCSSTKLLEL